MPRRLPLLARPDAHADDLALDAGPRVPLPRAVGIADTGDGREALAFARDLAAALAKLGAAPHLALMAIGAAPALAPADHAALASVASGVTLHAIAAHALAPALALPTGLVVLVGMPALARFAPALAVLVGVQRAPGQWPAALRAVREEVDLALTAPRPHLASVLAATLVADGFLLREGDGVR